MDVDNDLDGQLLQQFSSLGTTDKEVLIAEFQKLLGNQLTPAGCAFFLDMNNWNLQAAICAYYDFDQPNTKTPQLAFVGDVTIGDGEAVPPSTTFTKTWRVANSGEEAWPPGCQLKYLSGENLTSTDRVMVEALGPGETTDISVEMHSRSEPGVYQSQWRMSTAIGLLFGDYTNKRRRNWNMLQMLNFVLEGYKQVLIELLRHGQGIQKELQIEGELLILQHDMSLFEPIWVIITVAEGGVLGVTQQLSKFGNDFVHANACPSAQNPFGSPMSRVGGELNNSLLVSPNNSMVAQQGSPYTSQLSPSPTRTPRNNTSTPARSLFPVIGTNSDIQIQDCDNSTTIDTDDSAMS